MPSSQTQNFSLSIVSFFRKYFRNTWIHRLKITNIVYALLVKKSFKGEKKLITFRNYKLNVDTSDVTIVPTLMTGEYEKIELDLLELLLNKGDTFVDVGANIGAHSVLAALKVGNKGQEISFEAVQANVETLKSNITLNNVDEPTTIHHAAVGETSGELLKIYTAKNSIGTHSLVKGSGNYEEVRALSLDSLFTETRLERLDVLKVDVEGYEEFVFKGAVKTIVKHMPIIFTEIDRKMLKSSGRKLIFMETIFKMYDHIFAIDEKGSKLTKLTPKLALKLENANILLASNSDLKLLKAKGYYA